MRRRQLLAVSAAGVAGLAGCGGGTDSADTTTPGSGDGDTMATTTEGEDAMMTTTEESMATTTEAGGMALETPKGTVQTFYGTLYGEDDIEGANELYHSESPAPPVKAANFEPFGGIEAIQAEIESSEVVSRSEGTALVYSDVAYTTPAGSATETDYVYLRREDEQWQVNIWLPASARQRVAKETVTEFYTTLYSDNDIEAANGMYHPESDAPAIEAENFEPYGGLEAMQAEVQSAEIVSEGGGTAEVHADVEYTTPAGSAVDTDYLFLRLHRGAWRIDRWVPEAVREASGGTTTASGS